ncbi:Cas1p-domain-containing protein [Daldinia sp. FL1419]|nr:Cas1p-domain-containing protein [Daldinia sp. FL1419]
MERFTNYGPILPRLVNYAFFFIFVLVLVSQEAYVDSGQYDSHRCLALLQNGTWSPPLLDGSRRWEPKDCRMVEHTADSLCGCLNGRRVVFVGDSSIRQLFWAATRQATHTKSETRIDRVVYSNNKHHNLSVSTDCAQLEFIWDPWLNSTALHGILEDFHALLTPDEKAVGEASELPPTLVVLGAPGHWAARYGGDEYLNIFNRSITSIEPYLSQSLDSNISSAMEVTQDSDGVPNRVFLTPVGIPYYDHLAPNRSISITPGRIEAMNGHLAHVFPSNFAYVPWVYNQISMHPIDFAADGLHVSDKIAELRLNILFNAHCNSAANARSRSFKGTCCVTVPDNAVFTVVCIMLGVTVAFMSGARQAKKVIGTDDTLELALALTNILAALVWSWYTDGASYVAKIERHYQQYAFIIACFFWSKACFLWIRRVPQEAGSPFLNYRGPGYLSRSHSNEIKGLMQGFILLYHYHYASQALWVYKIIRLFIAGYLYISGYAHTLYLLTTNDFSLRRFTEILFRINMLSVLLSYMMGTKYTAYYFAPVATFWYVVLYTTLFFFGGRNSKTRRLLLGIVAMSILVNSFILKPSILEGFAKAIYAIFFISIDVEEMRFRLGLDRYITFVGMIVAALVHRASTRRARNLLGPVWVEALPLRPIALRYIVCVAAMGWFFFLTQSYLPDKRTYNQIHPYISWIPILCYIVLRNSHRWLRKTYLVLPSLLGQISLETYVLQYHIWLGGDATAKLTMGYWQSYLGRLAEIVLITSVFILLAAGVNHAIVSGLLSALWTANILYSGVLVRKTQAV